jgi:hypothetical protein
VTLDDRERATEHLIQRGKAIRAESAQVRGTVAQAVTAMRETLATLADAMDLDLAAIIDQPSPERRPWSHEPYSR